MKVRTITALALAWGLWAGSADAQQPRPIYWQAAGTSAVAPNANQILADNIAAQLRATGTASGADVSINAIGGAVEITGNARNAQQKLQIEKVISAVPGVTAGVRNNLVVSEGIPNAMPMIDGGPVGGGSTSPIPGIPIEGGVGGGAPYAGPIGGGPFVGGGVVGMNTDPGALVPPVHPQYDLNAPKMPPYAWPSYAPYNNFSRVAYPTAYPYNAWPYIGPFYPFPKVPLGWRKVTLEWEDGHWWYGRTGTPQDYWRVRYW